MRLDESTVLLIEDNPGDAGLIQETAGYTVLMANLGPNAINHAVYAKLPYDSSRDFLPVILTTKVPLVLVTAANAPIKDLKDLIEQGLIVVGDYLFDLECARAAGAHGVLVNLPENPWPVLSSGYAEDCAELLRQLS